MQQVWCKQLLAEKNITIAFLAKIASKEPLSLRLAASNEFQLFNNGKFTAYGPMRSAHGYSHVRTYRVFPDEAGMCTIAVLVCGSQINSYDRVNETPFFAAEVSHGKKILARTADFKAFRMTDRLQKVQRYSFQRTFTESYRLTGSRAALLRGEPCGLPALQTEPVHANRLLEEEGVHEPAYPFVRGSAVEYGTAQTDPDRKAPRFRFLTGETCVPEFFFYPESELEEILCDEAERIVCRPDTQQGELLAHNRYVCYDLGRNTSGFFRFDVQARKKTTLYLLFDEIAERTEEGGLSIDVHRLQCCNALKYVLEEGSHSVLSFAPYTARYVRLALLDGEAEIKNFGMIAYENPDDKLNFTCEDAELLQVIDAARATFRQNAVDVLTDCPSRERAGWLCDSYFTARAEKFITGENRVEKNFLQSLLLAPALPFAEGMMPMCYPADHVDGVYIPNWAMWYIIELKDYLGRTGDRDLTTRCKEKVYGVIRFLDRYRNEYGLLENLENWVFLEWSKANEFIGGVNFPSNMLYSFTLKCAAELYGDKELLKRSEEMKRAILSLSYNGEFFVDQAMRDKENKLQLTQNISETCQYYAFWTGVADKGSYPELYKTLLSSFSDRDAEKTYPNVYPSNAFIGRLLRMDYFLREKEYETVLKEAKTYYLPMAQRTGTLWENLTTVASCNHGFSGYIACLLVQAYTALHR